MTTNMQNQLPPPPSNKMNMQQFISDIVTETYLNNSHYQVIYNELEIILGNKNSRRLSNSELVDYFEQHKLVENEKFIKYICNKNNLFNNIYTDHYKNNIKDFELMTTLESMCQCWLMYLYH